MKQYDFDQLVTAVDLLSPDQRLQLVERLQHPETIPATIEHLDQRLRSTLRCHKIFTALNNTPLAHLRKRESWIERFHGVATKNLHYYLGWFRWFDQNRTKINQPFYCMEDFISAAGFQHRTKI